MNQYRNELGGQNSSPYKNSSIHSNAGGSNTGPRIKRPFRKNHLPGGGVMTAPYRLEQSAKYNNQKNTLLNKYSKR